MYIPPHFEQTDTLALHALVRAHPLATLITRDAQGVCVNHIPLLLSDEPPYDVLTGHVPRANPLWHGLSDQEVIAIFQGPNAYISPSWYESKRVSGKVVPTWNYAVVHAHGHARVVEDAAWLRAHLTQLTDCHEAGRAQPWAVSDAPAEFTDKLLGNLVGLEITITQWVGKWKLSQNRSAADRAGVVAGLRQQGDAADLQLAGLMDDAQFGQP